jgi:hypothetical protein
MKTKEVKIGDVVYSPYAGALMIVDEEDDLPYVNDHYSIIVDIPANVVDIPANVKDMNELSPDEIQEYKYLKSISCRYYN